MTLFPASNEFFALLRWASDGIALWVPGPWRIVYANPAFWQLTGVPLDMPAGDAPLDCLEPTPRDQLIELMERLARDDSAQTVLSARFEDVGGGTPVEVRLCRVARDEQPLIGMIVRGVTESPAGDVDAAQRNDPLTGLPDREFLMRRLAALLRGVRSADRHFAVLFLDLDNFKQVNDEFGHLIGDNVLREAARRIANCVREGDHVVRFGGDEFVALIEGVAEAHEVEPVISRIQSALGKPIALPEGEVTLSLSVGMAMASDKHASPEDLLAAADRAMYAAKRNL